MVLAGETVVFLGEVKSQDPEIKHDQDKLAVKQITSFYFEHSTVEYPLINNKHLRTRGWNNAMAH